MGWTLKKHHEHAARAWRELIPVALDEILIFIRDTPSRQIFSYPPTTATAILPGGFRLSSRRTEDTRERELDFNPRLVSLVPCNSEGQGKYCSAIGDARSRAESLVKISVEINLTRTHRGLKFEKSRRASRYHCGTMQWKLHAASPFLHNTP